MAQFDDWLTDRTLTHHRVIDFISNPANLGYPLGQAQLVCTSSGTTGVPGLYLHDAQAVAVYWANPILRGFGFWFGPESLAQAMRHGLRQAQVIGAGAHFGGAAWAALAQRRSLRLRKSIKVIPIQQTYASAIASLNAFNPAIVSRYSSSLEVLARAQSSGQLRIRPTLVATSGETMNPGTRQQIGESFGAMERTSYAASETLFMAHSCAQDWLHLSSDWYLLEPVASQGEPVPPGVRSHSVLVTNLANHLQPNIRYDLGDSVLFRAEPCRCGSHLPAFRVMGRSSELLRFVNALGAAQKVSPMLLGTALDLVPEAVCKQVIQQSAHELEIRFDMLADLGTTSAAQPERIQVGAALTQAVSQA